MTRVALMLAAVFSLYAGTDAKAEINPTGRPSGECYYSVLVDVKDKVTGNTTTQKVYGSHNRTHAVVMAIYYWALWENGDLYDWLDLPTWRYEIVGVRLHEYCPLPLLQIYPIYLNR